MKTEVPQMAPTETSTMSETAQRIAIAKASGVELDNLIDVHGGFILGLPDYLTDLNAMHEAEMIIDGKDVDTRSLWLDTLAVVCKWPETKNAVELRFEVDYVTARATAAQRAEAFLRTLNLWEVDIRGARLRLDDLGIKDAHSELNRTQTDKT